MNTTFKPKKYEVSGTGSGWGVWEIATNKKIQSFGSSKYGRQLALEMMYKMNEWNLPANFR